jgi:hypothetical protein
MQQVLEVLSVIISFLIRIGLPLLVLLGIGTLIERKSHERAR